MSFTSDLAFCDQVEELGLQRWRRVVVTDFHLRGRVAEFLKYRFHRVIAEYLAYSERVLGQYGNDFLEWDDFDVLLDTGVFATDKMASIRHSRFAIPSSIDEIDFEYARMKLRYFREIHTEFPHRF